MMNFDEMLRAYNANKASTAATAIILFVFMSFSHLIVIPLFRYHYLLAVATHAQDVYAGGGEAGLGELVVGR